MIRSIEELDRVRDECKSMVTKRSFASAGAAAIPSPGVDVAADFALLMEMVPAINRRFGLSAEQIDALDTQTKGKLVIAVTSIGSGLIGRTVTKEAILAVLKKVGVRVATKSVAKYVPVVGTVIASSVSFSAMKWMGNSHVDDCYNAVRRVLVEEEAPASQPS